MSTGIMRKMPETKGKVGRHPLPKAPTLCSPFSLLELHVLNSEGTAISLNLDVVPRFDAAMGMRFRQARLLRCTRIDVKSPDLRHKISSYDSQECTCLSQWEAAHLLRVSQGTVSKLEKGKIFAGLISFKNLVNVFGMELALWVVSGRRLDNVSKCSE